MQIGLVLEEVEMSPRHPFGVVRRAIGSTAARAGKATAGGEVYVDVKPPGLRIEIAASDRPRWCEAQCQLQQADIAHVGLPAIEPAWDRAWRRARRRQGRCAPPRDGLWPSLTAPVRGASR
jgi:hypothetical protein